MKIWEVIKSWQEGERGVYTAPNHEIRLKDNGIESEETERSIKTYLFISPSLLSKDWQKVEQEYSFAEAYEAYKNGAEIESVVTRNIKIYDSTRYFSDYEIDGKWLIRWREIAG